MTLIVIKIISGKIGENYSPGVRDSGKRGERYSEEFRNSRKLDPIEEDHGYRERNELAEYGVI